MLTGPLVRVRRRKGTARPAFIKTDDPVLEGLTESLQALFREAVETGMSLGALDAEVEALFSDDKDPRIGRGLAKLMFDKTTTDVDAPLPPPELRRRVFEAASLRGPLALERSALERPIADDVLADIATELGTTPSAVASGLYADLPHAQRVVACDAELDQAGPHLDRYNLALAQALLLKASSVTVTLDTPTAPRLRQLFRYLKMFRLLATARRDPATGALTLVVEGPLALFRQASRYGVQLANFLGALALHDRWTLSATLVDGLSSSTLELSSTDGLVSHYRDTGAWESKEQAWFRERFAAAKTDWTLDDRVTPIDLGGEAMVLPDFALRNGDRVAWLEIVGFWRKDWLERRMALLARFGPGNLVLAVSSKLATEVDAALPQEVVAFAEIVPVKDVLAAAERVAR